MCVGNVAFSTIKTESLKTQSQPAAGGERKPPYNKPAPTRFAMLGACLVGLGLAAGAVSLGLHLDRRDGRRLLNTPRQRGVVLGCGGGAGAGAGPGSQDEPPPYRFVGTIESSVTVGGLLLSGATLAFGNREKGLATLDASVRNRFTSSRVVLDKPLEVLTEGGVRVVFPELASRFTDLHRTSVQRVMDGDVKPPLQCAEVVTIELPVNTQVVLLDKDRELPAVHGTPAAPFHIGLGTSVAVKSLGDFNGVLQTAKASAGSKAPEKVAAVGVACIAIGAVMLMTK